MLADLIDSSWCKGKFKINGESIEKHMRAFSKINNA